MCCHYYCLYFFVQNDVANTINAKKGTVARFNGIQKMWVGADYWPLEGKWKWRNTYEDFNGMYPN